jgi:hypothetical protein
MNRKPETPDRNKQTTLRVEGTAPVSRLRELLLAEPQLKLEIVAPRKLPRRPARDNPLAGQHASQHEVKL